PRLNLLGHAEMDHLRVREYLVHGQDRPGRDARLVQLLDQVLGLPLTDLRRALLDQLLALTTPRSPIPKPLILQQMPEVQLFQERAQLVLAPGREVYQAVGGLEYTRREAHRMLVVGLLRHLLVG